MFNTKKKRRILAQEFNRGYKTGLFSAITLLLWNTEFSLDDACAIYRAGLTAEEIETATNGEIKAEDIYKELGIEDEKE